MRVAGHMALKKITNNTQEQMSCTRKNVAGLSLLLLIFLPGAADAGFYRCVQPDGNIIFTDTLVSEHCIPINLGGRSAVTKGTGSTDYTLLFRLYERDIRYFGVRYGIDPHLIRAIIHVESGFNPQAVSKNGAQGLMQLMPATAAELRVENPFNPRENIEGGTRYFRKLLNIFQQDVNLALAAYNAGPTVVQKQGGIPVIAETRNYVNRVLTYYRQYKKG